MGVKGRGGGGRLTGWASCSSPRSLCGRGYYNNNNNRELTEHFLDIKVLYLKKNIQCTNTHNYTNQ